MNRNNIILASASPRRQELLKSIFEKFAIIPADIDENVGEDIKIDDRPQEIARKKAEEVAKNHRESLVIGCDTAVIVENIMLGKPKDRDDAKNMIMLLSGRTHKVITGCYITENGRGEGFSSVTEVEFYPISDSEAENYLDTNEWTDKAGAYGIQGAAALFVKEIRGCYNNVVGLPVARLNRELKKFLNEE